MLLHGIIPLLLFASATLNTAVVGLDALAACPDEPPFDFSPCSVVDQRCRYKPVVCELTQEIFFSQTCFCFGDNTFGCAISDIVCPATDEPSPCPLEEPSTGDDCDIDSTTTTKCNYSPYGCPTETGDGIFLKTCVCENGAFTCEDFPLPNCEEPARQTESPVAPTDASPTIAAPTDTSLAPAVSSLAPVTLAPISQPTDSPIDEPPEILEECPDLAPVDSNACSGELVCDYGDFCCDDECVPFRQCTCSEDGAFVCDYPFLACRNFCPEEQPEIGSQCSNSERVDCDYGDFCCGSNCIPDKTCFCNEEAYECAEPIMSCPQVCPSQKPVQGDACDIPHRVDCTYNWGLCPNDEELPRSVCFCEDGVFVCLDLCPDADTTLAPISPVSVTPVASIAPLSVAPISVAPISAAPISSSVAPMSVAPMATLNTQAPVVTETTEAPVVDPTDAPVAEEIITDEPTTSPVEENVVVDQPPSPCPAVPENGCSVCGPGLCVTKLDEIFEFQPFPASPCGTLQEAGYMNALPDGCPSLPGLVETCGCKIEIPGTGEFAPTTMAPVASAPDDGKPNVAPSVIGGIQETSAATTTTTRQNSIVCSLFAVLTTLALTNLL